MRILEWIWNIIGKYILKNTSKIISSFNPLEFEGIRKQAGANAFTMSPRNGCPFGVIGIIEISHEDSE